MLLTVPAAGPPELIDTQALWGLLRSTLYAAGSVIGGMGVFTFWLLRRWVKSDDDVRKELAAAVAQLQAHVAHLTAECHRQNAEIRVLNGRHDVAMERIGHLRRRGDDPDATGKIEPLPNINPKPPRRSK